MKVVLDTNVLVSALIVKVGKPAQILRQVGTFEWLTSEEILAETERVLHYKHIRRRYRLADSEITDYLGGLRATAIIIKVTTNVHVVVEDPDDDKVLSCARQAGADYIVSGDPHLLRLETYQGIPILTPATFLDLLRNRAPA